MQRKNAGSMSFSHLSRQTVVACLGAANRENISGCKKKGNTKAKGAHNKFQVTSNDCWYLCHEGDHQVIHRRPAISSSLLTLNCSPIVVVFIVCTHHGEKGRELFFTLTTGKKKKEKKTQKNNTRTLSGTSDEAANKQAHQSASRS